VVQLGISQDFLRSGSLRTEQKQDTSEDFILNLSSRDPRKNIKRLIAAWHKVDPDLKRGVKLFVVGGQIKGVVNEGLGNVYDDDIIFLGYKKDEEIRELYRKAMFFVFPSLYEGFGLPPLEAMACGAPVIVSDVASLPEACGEAALYCNPIDENDIALKITMMLTNEALRRRLQREGLARAKGFTWEKSAEALLNVISTIIFNSSEIFKGN
jgi:glycosyltransferase involved in cell wall biosynthesis